MFQLPVITHSRVLVSLSAVRRAVASIVCVVVTPFRLSQMRCCTLQQLKCFPSVPNNCPDLGISLPLQFPHPLVAGPVLLTPLFPSFLHLTEYYMDLYIHFQLSETSSSSYLVFYEIFYTWRHSPDASVERAIPLLLIHPLLCCLVSYFQFLNHGFFGYRILSWELFFFLLFFPFFNFLFFIGVELINNVVITLGGQQRDSAIHIHVFILPQTPIPSTLLH